MSMISAMATTPSSPGMIWSKASHALRHEMGDDAFGSWLAPATLKANPDGGLCLVTPTGVARDWIRRYAWRRINELWAANDPAGRALSLKSRHDFEADGGADDSSTSVPEPARPSIVVDEVAAPPKCRTSALQERYTFDTFVAGPSNEFAHAVARRVASWTDGHFNPVVFHGPYGFGKTHLLNALAWEAMKTAPQKKVVYLTSERFLSTFIQAVMER